MGVIVAAKAGYTLYSNFVDAAALSASSQIIPVYNLKSMPPGKVWRASGCAEETVTVDLGSKQLVDAFAVVNQNMDGRGTIRVQFATDAGFSDVLFDETKRAIMPEAGLGYDPFGWSLGGYPRMDDQQRNMAIRTFLAPTKLKGRYARFTFKNPTLSVGYIQVGRLFVGRQYIDEFGYEVGWSYAWDDPSQVTPTERSVFTVSRPRFRTMTGKFPAMSPEAAFGAMDRMKKQLGKSRDLIVSAFPEGQWSAQRAYATAIYGMLSETAATGNPFFERFDTTLSARELVP